MHDWLKATLVLWTIGGAIVLPGILIAMVLERYPKALHKLLRFLSN